MEQKLNLPSFDVKLKTENSIQYIWDLIRKKYVVLTPEEWVRQHIVSYLILYKKYPKGLISLERGIKYNSLQKRYDVLVYDTETKPFMLIECKRTDVAIDKTVVKQAFIYNQTIKANAILLTNGLTTIYFQLIDSQWVQLKEIPNF